MHDMTDQPAAPRSIGRPPKQGAARRTWRPGPAFTQPEREAIEHAATQAGISVGAYIRAMTLTGRVVVHQHRELSSIDRADLGRVGSNINQIARHMNAGRAVPPDAIEAALREWIELAGRLE
jgi:hypothetical protein